MDIVRFGVGHRRPDGPPGSRNVTGQVIASHLRGLISELAFGRQAAIEPHSNPNATWFVVIEGGGFVRVGDEQSRVAAGEAVLWPPGVLHAAWTDQGQMRAIVVEFGGDESAASLVEGTAPHELSAGETVAGSHQHATGGSGRVAPSPGYDPREGEPL
jgi:mannose-6-phosphate isomerase-like protein (cupin superfamily)